MVDATDRLIEHLSTKVALDTSRPNNRVDSEQVSLVVDVDYIKTANNGPLLDLVWAEYFIDLHIQVAREINRLFFLKLDFHFGNVPAQRLNERAIRFEQFQVRIPGALSSHD
jgi:hypothetical protein